MAPDDDDDDDDEDNDEEHDNSPQSVATEATLESDGEGQVLLRKTRGRQSSRRSSREQRLVNSLSTLSLVELDDLDTSGWNPNLESTAED